MNSFPTRNLMALLGVLAFATVFSIFFSRPSVAYVPADAAATYKSKCISCHGADGKGQTPAGKKLGVKDFREFQGDRYAIITKGKGKMPAYEKSLGADKCKELAEYIQNTFK